MLEPASISFVARCSAKSGLSVLVETVLLAAVASMASPFPVTAAPAASLSLSHLLAVRAPWRVLQLTPPLAADCAHLEGELLPCSAAEAGPDLDEELPASDYVPGSGVRLPSVSDEMGGTLGGFLNVDMMDAPHLSAGPELSWLTPDSPREDLLRLRVVAPGWGIRYTWQTWGDGAISAGIAVGPRFVMFGEDFPVVDVLTSEARIELALP